MVWDGKERRKTPRLSDDDKREIAQLVFDQVEQRVGRGTLAALRKACWAACIAGLGYLWAHIEKWLK